MISRAFDTVAPIVDYLKSGCGKEKAQESISTININLEFMGRYLSPLPCSLNSDKIMFFDAYNKLVEDIVARDMPEFESRRTSYSRYFSYKNGKILSGDRDTYKMFSNFKDFISEIKRLYKDYYSGIILACDLTTVTQSLYDFPLCRYTTPLPPTVNFEIPFSDKAYIENLVGGDYSIDYLAQRFFKQKVQSKYSEDCIRAFRKGLEESIEENFEILNDVYTPFNGDFLFSHIDWEKERIYFTGDLRKLRSVIANFKPRDFVPSEISDIMSILWVLKDHVKLHGFDPDNLEYEKFGKCKFDVFDFQKWLKQEHGYLFKQEV